MVGPSLKHDLKALGIVHGRVVDTAILTAEVLKGYKWEDLDENTKLVTKRVVDDDVKLGNLVGLQVLAEELLGVKTRGDGVHDSLEDVVVTRDVLVWCLLNPDKLHHWAVEREGCW